MDRVLAAGILLPFVAIAIGCSPRAPEAAAPSPSAAQAPPAASVDGIPGWVPPLTPEQIALLSPVDRPIQTPAGRVFPDLGRFGYAQSRPLSGPEEPLKFTKMVATILNDSPRFYSLDEAGPDLANTIAQYGPAAAEADGLKVARVREGGSGELVDAEGSAEAREALARGAKLEGAAAIEAYRAAIAKSPRVPALRHALGAALARAGKAADAQAAYREAIRIDPTYAPPHIALADLAERRNDVAAARRELVEGLAYHPSSREAFAIAARLGGGVGRQASARAPLFPIFLDVDRVGAIHVGTGKGGPAQIYGGCRAIMRYEPEVRAQIFEQPPETPYYLTVVEEVICLEAALGAYIAERAESKGHHETADPRLDALIAIGRDEGLSGYAMFEILGQHRPERARTAPPEVHRAMTAYVERHVFGQKDALPEGVYTAQR
jgi:tetratricopeptide (TPR) repeat protein